MTRVIAKSQWRSHPKCSIFWVETAFLERIGAGARKVSLRYVLKQIEVVEIVIETFYELYKHCMGDAMQFSMMVRSLGGVHAVADMQQTIHSASKGDLFKRIPYGLRFVVLRVSLRSVSMLKEMASALSMTRARTVLYMLSTVYNRLYAPLFDASYADIYRAVYSAAARPVRYAKADLPGDSQLHRDAGRT